jgi:hypothetical protein
MKDSKNNHLSLKKEKDKDNNLALTSWKCSCPWYCGRVSELIKNSDDALAFQTKTLQMEVNEFKKIAKELEEILKSPRSSYEKKIALFELVENIELEDIEPKENERVNYLLRSRLLTELAKKNYKKYQLATADEFSGEK